MGCSGCSQYFSGAADFAKSALVLVAATTYQIIVFMIILSASIGPSVLLSRIYDYLTGLDPLPQVVEAVICMVLIRCWGEFLVAVEEKLCGRTWKYWKSRYPCTMSICYTIVSSLLYIAAFSELYFEFQDSHMEPQTSHRKIDEFEHKIFLYQIGKSRECHTTLFLLSLSYLVYITSKSFHKYVLLILDETSTASYSIVSNCMVRFGFSILHLVMNVIYFLPCLAIAYTARSYKTAAHTTFFQLAFTAGLCGLIAALFELNKPWPRQAGKATFYPLENNLIAKDGLILFLVSLILITFYRPFGHEKIPESMFDSTNSEVSQFCMSVAFTLLHVMKFGVHSVLSIINDIYDPSNMHNQGERGRMNQLNIIIPSDDSMDGSSQQSTAIRPRHEVGPNGMCQRCNADALNNNSYYTPPRSFQPPVNNEQPAEQIRAVPVSVVTNQRVELSLETEQVRTVSNNSGRGDDQAEVQIELEDKVEEIEMIEVDLRDSQQFIV